MSETPAETTTTTTVSESPLPEVKVPTDELQKVLDAFGGEAGYVNFIKSQAAERTLAFEANAERDKANQALQDKINARRQELYTDFGISQPGGPGGPGQPAQPGPTT